MAEKDIPATKPKTMRLTEEQWIQIDQYAQELQISKSKVLQLSVGLGLRGLRTTLDRLIKGEEK